MSLSGNLIEIKEKIIKAQRRGGLNHPVLIVAATKTHPPQLIEQAYASGLRCIGENRVQEAEEKFSLLPNLPGLEKRMIGHLQSNKINKAIRLFDSIDSINSLSLAEKLNVRANNRGRTVSVLLEINTSGEETKSGFDPQNEEEMLACFELSNIKIKGLMTVGPFVEDQKETRQAFSLLRELKEGTNSQISNGYPKMKELSMGMSGDFEIAMEEGSTMVRLGTALFGSRREHKKLLT
ncbi:MAG TPA: YggS family pyridoxal phosphate-dependent enzyme [Candidatus Marinimicrobia bacterium]|nr:YggS family pyridoxal phosphate-dependent enzyme [Candidatus Neomarinimicrobiota bacterium]HJL78807.1 YggS family pyridoxal phosphate-dependent enzyme [Candidatus Neomarinimicrobiota bacterium]HJN68453.1 YggS family pyridoxal phosphate-dependent enzyme [Candidatus Neomarinimicrobiota bacterium]